MLVQIKKEPIQPTRIRLEQKTISNISGSIRTFGLYVVYNFFKDRLDKIVVILIGAALGMTVAEVIRFLEEDYKYRK